MASGDRLTEWFGSGDLTIFNIRGTSGSGKTTIVRAIMDRCEGKARIRKPGRRQPIGYTFTRPLLFVTGSYETTCGGCDTISTYAECYGAVAEAARNGYHVLYEGLRQSGDFKQANLLHEAGHPIVIVSLTTSLEDCLASVRARREARGDMRELDPTNTEAKVKSITTSNSKLRERGVAVHELDREQALKYLCGNLGMGDVI